MPAMPDDGAQARRRRRQHGAEQGDQERPGGRGRCRGGHGTNQQRRPATASDRQRPAAAGSARARSCSSCRRDLAISSLICANTLWPRSAVTLTLSQSDSTRVPPITAERSPPLSRMTGADSPVTADSSTSATPSITSPSAGMMSPASHQHHVADVQRLAGHDLVQPVLAPVVRHDQALGRDVALQRAQAARPREGAGLDRRHARRDGEQRQPEPERHLADERGLRRHCRRELDGAHDRRRECGELERQQHGRRTAALGSRPRRASEATWRANRRSRLRRGMLGAHEAEHRRDSAPLLQVTRAAARRARG